MRPMTKIDFIRNEFIRIGCPSPAYVLDYRLNVEWHFSNIIIRGKKIRSIDYDMLVEILKGIPDNAGEDKFWQIFENTNMQELADRINERLLKEFKEQMKIPKLKKNTGKKLTKKKISKTRKKKR